MNDSTEHDCYSETPIALGRSSAACDVCGAPTVNVVPPTVELAEEEPEEE